jgi:hypothetical protein
MLHMANFLGTSDRTSVNWLFVCGTLKEIWPQAVSASQAGPSRPSFLLRLATLKGQRERRKDISLLPHLLYADLLCPCQNGYMRHSFSATHRVPQCMKSRPRPDVMLQKHYSLTCCRDAEQQHKLLFQDHYSPFASKKGY